MIALCNSIKTGYGIQISVVERPPEAQFRVCGGDEGNLNRKGNLNGK